MKDSSSRHFNGFSLHLLLQCAETKQISRISVIRIFNSPDSGTLAYNLPNSECCEPLFALQRMKWTTETPCDPRRNRQGGPSVLVVAHTGCCQASRMMRWSDSCCQGSALLCAVSFILSAVIKHLVTLSEAGNYRWPSLAASARSVAFTSMGSLISLCTLCLLSPSTPDDNLKLFYLITHQITRYEVASLPQRKVNTFAYLVQIMSSSSSCSS